VHDYFDILGVPTNAAASEVRRASARLVRRAHPDFSGVRTHAVHAAHPDGWREAAPADVAVDFPDVVTIIDRVRAAFFRLNA
jgi:hypothetical protein